MDAQLFEKGGKLGAESVLPQYLLDSHGREWIDRAIFEQKMRLHEQLAINFKDKQHYVIRFSTIREDRGPDVHIRTTVDVKEVQYQHYTMIPVFDIHGGPSLSAERPKSWKCVYCGGMQPPDTYKCGNCNANRLD